MVPTSHSQISRSALCYCNWFLSVQTSFFSCIFWLLRPFSRFCLHKKCGLIIVLCIWRRGVCWPSVCECVASMCVVVVALSLTHAPYITFTRQIAQAKSQLKRQNGYQNQTWIGRSGRGHRQGAAATAARVFSLLRNCNINRAALRYSQLWVGIEDHIEILPTPVYPTATPAGDLSGKRLAAPIA